MMEVEEVTEVTEVEMGVDYYISNRNRWGAVEVGVFNKEGSPGVNVQIEWKRAEGRVTPSTQEEVDLLNDLLKTKGELCLSDIKDSETYDTMDGNEYFVYHQGWSEEDKEALEAEYDNDEDGSYFDRRDLLEVKGYEHDYYELYLTDIILEEAVGEDTSNEPVGQYGFDDNNDDIDGEWNRWASESKQ